MSQVYCIAILCALLYSSIEARRFGYVLKDRPIIGVLAQEHYDNWESETPEKSYIAASYVKFVEGAGARVVPILVNQNETYLRNIFESINGVLFPGGAVSFKQYPTGYVEASLTLYKLAIEANEKGDYFPIWGTCLGFEIMLFAAAGEKEIRADCGAWNVVNKLKFQKDSTKSRLYGKAPKAIIQSLQTKPVAANFHHFCVTPENFTKFGLDTQYRVLSTNYDSSTGLEYISSTESIKYPFYAVQFHPEKNLYEWTTKEKIPHSPDAMKTAQFYANFFVSEARKNTHGFPDKKDETEQLIYNYQPVFSGANGSTFDQLYYFPF